MEGLTNKRLAIIIIITFTVFLRAHWIFNNDASFGGDEPVYDSLAKRILTGQGITLETGEPTAWRTPGFPLLLGLIYRLTGNDRSHARAVLALLTGLTSLGVFWLCFSLTKDVSIAFLSGLGWESLLMTNRLAGTLMGESSAALIFVGGLILVVASSRRDSIILAGAAGALLGFAALVRAYLIFVPLGPFVWLLLEKKRRFAAVFLLSFSAVVAGWMTRNLVAMGAFTLSTEGPHVMWCGNNAWARGSWPGEWMKEDSEQRKYLQAKYPEYDGAGEVAKSRIYAREAIHQLTHHPAHVLWLAPRKIAIFFSPFSTWGNDWVYLALLPFALIGAVHLWRSQNMRRALWLIAAPAVGVMIVCLLTFGDPRFRHPVDPMIAILAGVGMVLLSRFRRGRGRLK
jgi:4-amino-4-deoxy-L-arabinose transferase-like glycosyltransferase